MKDIIMVIILIILTLLGGLAGYELGDIIIHNSTEIRSKDLIRCRIIYPIAGLCIGFLVGGIVTNKR